MTLPLSNEVTIQENSTQLLKCTSSGGFPEPIVKWYNDSKTPGDTSDDKEITSLITSSYSNTSDDLIIITSTLTFTASKYDNQIDIYCSAYISLDQTPVNSTRTAKLNVLYGPDGPPKIQGFAAGATYRVIEDRQGQLTCTIKGGNPLPTLSWTCFNTGVLNNTDADTVSKTARWTAVRGQDRNCTCQSSHFSGNASVEIQVLILVQVSSVMLKEGSSPLSGQLQVEIGVSKTLTCDTDTSIPAATIVWYIGTEEKQRSTSNSYTFKPDSNDHYKSTYCKAFNIQPESEAVSSNKTSLTIKGMPSIPRLLYYIGLYGGVNMFIFVGGENDGGRLQTFVIDTKRNGTSKWIEQLRFNETDTSYLQNEESLYRFNIRGLIPGVYNIRVIAGNEIAWIADDIAPMIQFTVIELEDQEYSKQEQSDDTAAIVGGSLSVVIVGILVTSVFIMRRMTWKKEDKKESENKPGSTYDSLQTQHELQTTYSTLTPETDK